MACWSEEDLIIQINSLYPIAKATPLKDFYGDDDSVGIWFRGSEEHLDGRLIYDNYDHNDFCHPKINALLEKANWTWEAYDSGTMMAYPN